jgi:hypothetical protein
LPSPVNGRACPATASASGHQLFLSEMLLSHEKHRLMEHDDRQHDQPENVTRNISQVSVAA